MLDVVSLGPRRAVMLAAVAPFALAAELIAMMNGPRAALGVAMVAFAVCVACAIACVREQRRDDDRTHLVAQVGAGLATLCAVLVVAFAVPLLAVA